MGQRGVIRGFVDFSDDGVGNFQVELESVQSRVTIQALNLLPLCVNFTTIRVQDD